MEIYFFEFKHIGGIETTSAGTLENEENQGPSGEIISLYYDIGLTFDFYCTSVMPSRPRGGSKKLGIIAQNHMKVNLYLWS